MKYFALFSQKLQWKRTNQHLPAISLTVLSPFTSSSLSLTFPLYSSLLFPASLRIYQTSEPSRPEELDLLAESQRGRHGVRRAGLRHVQSAVQTSVILGPTSTPALLTFTTLTELFYPVITSCHASMQSTEKKIHHAFVVWGGKSKKNCTLAKHSFLVNSFNLRDFKKNRKNI